MMGQTDMTVQLKYDQMQLQMLQLTSFTIRCVIDNRDTCLCCSLLSPHSCPKELKQSGSDSTMDMSGKVKLHIANVPYEMKWQELKDLLRDRGEICSI